MDGPTIAIEQQVPRVANAQVYAAWLDPEQLRRWWWPQLPDTTYQVEPWVDGGYQIHSQTAGFGCRGRYVELEEPHRIVMTWVWEPAEDDVSEDLVTVTLTPFDDGTVVHLSHQMAAADDPSGLEQGWSDVLARLAELAD